MLITKIWFHLITEQNSTHQCFQTSMNSSNKHGKTAHIYASYSVIKLPVCASSTSSSSCSNKSSTNWTRLLVGGTTRRRINPTPEGSNSPVDTVFWHVSKKVIFVKRRWLIWKKPKDAQCWNRPMESVRWTRGICREDADLSVLVFGR